MPCCIAIVHFNRCRHHTLLKIQCTDGCEGLCPPEKQETLVMTKYMWRCEDCHYHHTHQEDLARELKWEDEVNRVEDEIFDDTNQVAGPLAEARAMIVDAVRAREEYESETLTLKRGEQMDEIQWVEQWTSQYGHLLFELKYDPAVDRELTDRRKGYLLSVKVWGLLEIGRASCRERV